MREWTGHITEEQLNAWTSGTLSEEEERKIFAHISACDFCAELLACALEQDLLLPPAYLEEEILEKSRQADVRAVRTIHQTSRQMRLFYYSLKVGFALAVSLLALFILPMDGRLESLRETHLLERTGRKVTERLEDGSEQINDFLEELSGWTIFINW